MNSKHTHALKVVSLAILVCLGCGLASKASTPTVRWVVREHDHARLVAEKTAPLGTTQMQISGVDWKFARVGQADESSIASGTLKASIQPQADVGKTVSAGIQFVFDGWSRDHYVLFPGAVYAGNRFLSISSGYPLLTPSKYLGKNPPTIIADIPRLNLENGPSRLQLLAGDMSWPACAIYDPHQKRGLIVRAPAFSAWGQMGFDFAENENKDRATLTITSPGVRETRYNFLLRNRISTEAPSSDLGRMVRKGETLTLSLQIEEFPCQSVQELFDRVFVLSRCDAVQAEQPLELPFSAMHELIERHYNHEFWDNGLYRTNTGDRNPYQTGWCGGIIAEYALLANTGSSTTADRCRQHLERALSEGMAPGGLFYGQYYQGKWVADHLRYAATAPEQQDFTLTRRQGDALLYALKAISVLEKNGEKVPAHWDKVLANNAEALCRIWKTDAQFGQFLHQATNAVALGQSASGGIIPAALCLAYDRYRTPQFLDVAKESARHYYDNYIKGGITNGGPGDAAQAPDSESCAALMESFAILYETTGDREWLVYAEATARQFATWVMPYNYEFPAGSEFQRLGMKTVGTVFANAQNKHSSAGICTHSGRSLLSLYRATGNMQYLELLRDIARSLPQYVSREDRKIVASNKQPLPSGWINERVNTSDWDDNVGGVFYGPCWNEVSAMLTYAEIPGIYAQPDKGVLCVIDNVEAKWEGRDTIVIKNPTKFPARVLLMTESGKESLRPLPQAISACCQTVVVDARSTVRITVDAASAGKP